jgi:drug/metabolite transporter (DMT)-like permease
MLPIISSIGEIAATTISSFGYSHSSTCYGIGAIVYILLLTRVNLSIAAPAISLSYIFSVLLGHFWFREAIVFSQVIGLAAISIGVILVVSQK